MQAKVEAAFQPVAGSDVENVGNNQGATVEPGAATPPLANVGKRKTPDPSPMKFRLLVHAEKQLLADAERDKC